MGNSISNTIVKQLCTSCCTSVSEPQVSEPQVLKPQVKYAYENNKNETIVDPIHQENIQLKISYRDCTCENTPNYSYVNLKKLIKVLNVIDGDTIDLALHSDDTGKIFKHRVRLYGIDTPEMHPSLSNPDRAKEIEASKQAKAALTQRLQENDNLVIAHFNKFDKYGRLMATLYDAKGEDINNWMITSGHALAYFGKKKGKFSERSPSEEKKEETIK
jgi:micrococcal nuclease